MTVELTDAEQTMLRRIAEQYLSREPAAWYIPARYVWTVVEGGLPFTATAEEVDLIHALQSVGLVTQCANPQLNNRITITPAAGPLLVGMERPGPAAALRLADALSVVMPVSGTTLNDDLARARSAVVACLAKAKALPVPAAPAAPGRAPGDCHVLAALRVAEAALDEVRRSLDDESQVVR